MDKIAAFDFDGTLTYHDSLFSFLYFVKGPLKTFYHLFLNLPYLIGYVFGNASRQETKERILRAFFGKMRVEEFNALGKAFAAGPLNGKIRPEALERLKWHQAQGHRCILISASITTYLIPWGEAHGFHDVIASIPEEVGGFITGKLVGRNCWGEEKVRRIKELLGDAPYVLYAYGDSRGDLELLKMADHPFYRTFRLDP